MNLEKSQEEINVLLNDDVKAVKLANDERLSLASSPTQSEFRVLALLFVRKPKDDDSFVIVRGANSEQGYIGGATCAERAALVQLR